MERIGMKRNEQNFSNINGDNSSLFDDLKFGKYAQSFNNNLNGRDRFNNQISSKHA